MKTPPWVIIVSICLMFFGGCDTIGHVFEVASIQLSDKEFNFGEFNTDSKSDDEVEKKSMSFKFNEKSTLNKVLSYIGLFVSIFYFAAGIILLTRMDKAIQIVQGALALSILYILALWLLVPSPINSMEAIVFNSMYGLSIAIDVILLLVVTKSDRTVFLKENTAET